MAASSNRSLVPSTAIGLVINNAATARPVAYRVLPNRDRKGVGAFHLLDRSTKHIAAQLHCQDPSKIWLQPNYFPKHPTKRGVIDRKSTRLNSSHLGISYAVFCLK